MHHIHNIGRVYSTDVLVKMRINKHGILKMENYNPIQLIRSWSEDDFMLIINVILRTDKIITLKLFVLLVLKMHSTNLKLFDLFYIVVNTVQLFF